MALYTACRFITVEDAAQGAPPRRGTPPAPSMPHTAAPAMPPTSLATRPGPPHTHWHAGFGNTSLLAVMALYAAAEGVSQTGGACRRVHACAPGSPGSGGCMGANAQEASRLAPCPLACAYAGLERVMNAVLGSSAHNMFWVYAKMVIPVMVASAFVNNTRELRAGARGAAAASFVLLLLSVPLMPPLPLVQSLSLAATATRSNRGPHDPHPDRVEPQAEREPQAAAAAPQLRM